MVRNRLFFLLGFLAFPNLALSRTGQKLASRDIPVPAVTEPAAYPYAGGFQQRMYKSGRGDSIRYLLFIPRKYNPKKRYPLVLWLHGRSYRGNDLHALLSWGDAYGPLFFARPENQEKYPCFIVAPQCPLGQLWAGPWGEPASRQEKLIVKLVKHLHSRYKIDSKRQYVVGVSMGGFGTWDIISRYPKTFAAAMPMCGGGDPAKAAGLKLVAIWAFHGKADELVPPTRSREMVQAAKKSGANVKYTEYRGVGHDVWEPAFQEPKFLSWLFAQKRK